MRHSETEKQEAKANLLKWIKPGDTVYTILDHVSSSGMSRDIRVVLLKCDGHGRVIDMHPNHAVETLLGYRSAKKGDGMRVGGCGMDMGFHIVHSLGYALFGKEASEGTDAAATTLRRAILKVTRGYLTQQGAEAPDPRKPDQRWYGAAGYAIEHRWL